MKDEEVMRFVSKYFEPLISMRIAEYTAEAVEIEKVSTGFLIAVKREGEIVGMHNAEKITIKSMTALYMSKEEDATIIEPVFSSRLKVKIYDDAHIEIR